MITLEKTYYINLKNRLDRKKHIENQIINHPILKNIERIEAVDGTTIDPRTIKILTQNCIDNILCNNLKWGLSVTHGALGLILTYSILLEKITNLKNPALILEDDIIITNNFNDIILEILKELPDNFDLCYLGYGDTNFDKTPFSKNLFVPTGQFCCTPGLIVSPQGAKKINKLLDNINYQIDTILYQNFYQLNVYASEQQITKVSNSLGTNIQNQNLYQKNNTNFEIHSLICKKDLDLAINNLQILQTFEYFKSTPIVLHDDGTITDHELNILKNSLQNISLINKTDADIKIKKFIENKKYCNQYRLQNHNINLWHKIKLFDYWFFSQTKQIIGVDSDILFVKQPNNIIDLLEKKNSVLFS